MSILLIFTLSGIGTFSSCNLYRALKLGYKANHVRKSENQLLNYLAKHKIDTTQVYFLNDPEFFSPRFQSDSSMDSNEFRAVQFRVFDSSGKIVNLWASCYGPISFYLKDVGEMLTKRIRKDLILTTNVADYTSLMRYHPHIEYQKYDIVIVAFWAWYMEHHSLDMLKEIQALPNANNKKVLFVKLNIDDSKP